RRPGREDRVEVRGDDRGRPAVGAEARDDVARGVARRRRAGLGEPLGDGPRALLLGAGRRRDRAQREGVRRDAVEVDQPFWTLSRSTTKIRVSFGAMSGGAPWAP